MEKNSMERRYRRSLLLVLLVILLVVQACSASDLKMDMVVSPQNLYLGNSPMVSVHVYDINHPQFMFLNIPIFTKVMYVDTQTEVPSSGGLTNASGWYTFSFTPQVTGTYRIFADTTVNYSAVPGLPDIGNQHALKFQYHNVTSWSPIPHHTIPQGVLLTVITTTAPPVTTTQTAQQTTPVTQVTQTSQVTPVTQITQVTQATLATSTVPASQSDTTPPVTTLTLAGTGVGSGGYSSDVICTLTAADNSGGSGVKVTQYSFDGTSWYTYSQPVSVVKTGVTTLYYRSADNAGNLEVAQLKAIVISTPGAAPAGTIAPGTRAAGNPPAASSPTPGSGPSLPLWLMALILLIIIAAIGGVLYWKSRPKEEPKK